MKLFLDSSALVGISLAKEPMATMRRLAIASAGVE